MKRILLVEDDNVLRKSLEFYLVKNGFTVISYDNGEDAIHALDQEYDLIITDLNMPYAGGQVLINAIRKTHNLSTPIIVLTSLGVESTELEVFQMGADEFISKPFSPHILLARITKILRIS
jgi:DNA-binding response OmpR family regulator